MGISFLVWSFTLGLIIGSFLNVLILRLNTGRSLKGRSACFSCTKQLLWYELIPLVSFVIQGGRCRGCGSRISPQYPLVELGTGLLWLGVAWKTLQVPVDVLAIAQFLLSAGLMSILMGIFVYDLKHQIIPNILVYTGWLLALAHVVFLFKSSDSFLYTIIAGVLVPLPLFLLWFLSRGRWMGFGDVKLVLILGWFLGLQEGLSALLLAFWIGALVSVGMLFFSKMKVGSVRLVPGLSRLTMKSEVPFAPFLIVGLWVVYFFDINLVAGFW